MIWNTWTLDRSVILFTAFAYLFIAAQVTLSHYRQNFHRKVMLIPVITAPLYFLVGLLAVLLNRPWFLHLFHMGMWLGILTGLYGLSLHIRGVGKRVGSYAFRNFLIGPPVLMPLLYSALGVLGLIAVYGR
ncbi:hypothetical protein ACI48J_25180 [Paenibacillus chitinolyticus]|uniref:hypothetical protein n=1 Tax=Paenibacillus chitinolyticus TaxID=79263 RepID=UPI002DBF2F5D|nr:hypothetical protein [Paenibacillus chitinolyticus]MEC0244888.1 hypothetical protein [Paenibacillus chitinolyticus]